MCFLVPSETQKFERVKNIFISVLENYAPVKEKTNHAPDMTKMLRKVIMRQQIRMNIIRKEQPKIKNYAVSKKLS